jgi:hypothetical protein
MGAKAVRRCVLSEELIVLGGRRNKMLLKQRQIRRHYINANSTHVWTQNAATPSQIKYRAASVSSLCGIGAEHKRKGPYFSHN